MRFRRAVVFAVLCAVLGAGLPAAPARAQQSGGTPYQRLEVVRRKLEGVRRSLSTALANFGDGKEQKDKQAAAAQPSDAAARLRGLDKETGTLLSEQSDLRSRVERSERYDVAQIDKLESATNDLNDRVEAALRETAGPEVRPAGFVRLA